MPSLLLLQDASTASSAAIWIPIAAQVILAVIGWMLVWKIASRPVQVTLLAAQPEEKAMKATAHDGTPGAVQLMRVLPLLGVAAITSILYSAFEFYVLFAQTVPLRKSDLLIAISSTLILCNAAAMLILVLRIRRKYKPVPPPEAEVERAAGDVGAP